MTQDSGLRTQDSGLRTQDSGLRTNYANVKFEEYEHERLDEIYNVVKRYSMMAHNERYFVNGIIRYFKPSKILELGVARGGGTAMILNAIRDLPSSKLISVDHSEKYYSGNIGKLSGFLIDEQFAHLKDKWTIYRGGDVSRFIEKIGGDIDLLVLDTVHIHPWETLNFLCVLPFMKRNSWVVLHDINQQFQKGLEEDLACRYLFGHVVSDAKIMPVADDHEFYHSGDEFHFANIGAFHVTDDTVKYVRNLFECLLCPWNALPGMLKRKNVKYIVPAINDDIDDIKVIINKYYPKYGEFFENIIAEQNLIDKHRKEIYDNKKWERNFPWTVAVCRFLIEQFRLLKKQMLRHYPKLYDGCRKVKHAILRR